METEHRVTFSDVQNPSKEEEKDEDAIEQCIGEMGKYQMIVCLLVFITKLPVAFHQMGVIFFTPPTDFICLDDGKNIKNHCPCVHKEYNRSIFEETIVMSWDLVCERGWLADLTQTLFMLGILVGSFIFGSMSDKYGRRRPMLGAVVLQLVTGVAAAFAAEFWSFTWLRFLLGAATGGTMVSGWVLAMEFVGKTYREPLSALYQLPVNFGILTMSVFGYYCRTWTSLQLCLTFPSFLMLSYYWLLPESPRWLLAVGQTEEAIAVLEKSAAVNGLPVEPIAGIIKTHQTTLSKGQPKRGTFVDLFKTPNMRKNTICIAVNWLVCGFGYYGVSQYIGKLAGNIFVNVAISAIITIPATLVSIPLMRRFGRKTVMICTLIMTSVCLFAIATIPTEAELGKVILACIGDMGAFVGFIVIYLHASELFPTVVRNIGIGLSSVMARVGSMVTPFVASMGARAEWLPPVIFGLMPLVGAALCLMMPETKDCQLTDTVEEAENFGRKKK